MPPTRGAERIPVMPLNTDTLRGMKPFRLPGRNAPNTTLNCSDASSSAAALEEDSARCAPRTRQPPHVGVTPNSDTKWHGNPTADRRHRDRRVHAASTKDHLLQGWRLRSWRNVVDRARLRERWICGCCGRFPEDLASSGTSRRTGRRCCAPPERDPWILRTGKGHCDERIQLGSGP